jgi:peptidoglycan biosynthesis protein MviN/MurJ (putative lipid II flippase)
LFPVLSEAFSRRDEKRFGRVLADGWNLSAFVAVPAGVALYFLAAPASDALLGWSNVARPELVTAVLQGLAVGVPPWVVLATIVRAFYARGATARPALLYGLAFAVVAVVGLGGTAITGVTGTAALRLLGIAVGAGWWLAVIVGVVLLVSVAREWSVVRALRSVTASVARGAVLGLAVWLTLRLVGDTSSVLALAASTAVGGAVMAGLGSRSAELRAAIAVAVKGESPGGSA